MRPRRVRRKRDHDLRFSSHRSIVAGDCLPVMAIMSAAQVRPGFEARLRTVFPNLRKYEAWEGAGHFPMMESPDRFNRALEDFLAER